VTEHGSFGYGLYWKIWGILLVMTLGMIFFDQAPVPRVVLVVFLIVAMLVKAALVAGYFMHLRYESVALGLTVVVGMLITGLILFVLIAPDGMRILELSDR